ncbi:class I SAM-dependent methyltransferase [candidate division KSB1 bacterium]|nr:class I SAM-dependent methyltransferase [candidate division KSB1 bacterium]
MDSGLSRDETELINAIPAKTGKVLVLGVGGGREAIVFARMGFQVTGVDFVQASVERSIENATARGVEIKGLIQEISRLDVAENSYDMIWISRAMYSCVPTRLRRVNLVQKLARALKPGGYIICQFHRQEGADSKSKLLVLRRLIALMLANRDYESGNFLWGNIEFIHAFSSDEQIRSELTAGGLDVLEFKQSQNPLYRAAICQKSFHTIKNKRQ